MHSCTDIAVSTFTLTFYRVAQAKSSRKKNKSAPGQASAISVVKPKRPRYPRHVAGDIPR
jgi:hypothetical protein